MPTSQSSSTTKTTSFGTGALKYPGFPQKIETNQDPTLPNGENTNPASSQLGRFSLHQPNTANENAASGFERQTTIPKSEHECSPNIPSIPQKENNSEIESDDTRIWLIAKYDFQPIEENQFAFKQNEKFLLIDKVYALEQLVKTRKDIQ